MWETRVWSLGQEDPLEKEMVTHACVPAWRIPWTEKPGRLQSMGSQRVRHDWATSLSLSFTMNIGVRVSFWASLVAQPVKNPPAMWKTWVRSLGQEDPLEKGKATHSSILAWRIPWTWGCKESEMTEQLSIQFKFNSAFFTVQLSHPYMTTGKMIALTIWTFVGNVMSLLFNMLSRFVRWC